MSRRTKRLPPGWPYASFDVATTWYGWLPRIKHNPATYHRVHSRIDAALAPAGARMSQPSFHLYWGPLHAALVLP